MHRSSPHFQFVQYEYRYSLQSIFGRRNGILLRSEIIIDQLYGYSCTGTQYEYSTPSHFSGALEKWLGENDWAAASAQQ